MLKHFCQNLDCEMENQGDKLVITIKGDKDKIATAEKKLKAMKELCCGDDDCECDDDCTCGCRE